MIRTFFSRDARDLLIVNINEVAMDFRGTENENWPALIKTFELMWALRHS